MLDAVTDGHLKEFKVRVLPVADIPEELWCDDKLHLPGNLKGPYREKLDELGMLQKAVEGKPGSAAIHGGISDEEAIEHFVYRFAASSGRVEFVAISPVDSLAPVSNAILSTFSTGEVSVLDIPGGAGAAMCSMLTTMALLRKEGVLPALPLTVRIVCGDLSPQANALYADMVSKVDTFLRENSISIQFESMIWDATRNDHTAKLLDRWFAISKPTSEYVVCISNFTGALIGAGILEEFKPCLNQILARLHDKKSTLLWVEPGSNHTNKLVKNLAQYFSSAIKWFKGPSAGEGFKKSKYKMINPLNGSEYSSSIEVERFERL